MTYKDLFYFTGHCLALDEHPDFWNLELETWSRETGDWRLETGDWRLGKFRTTVQRPFDYSGHLSQTESTRSIQRRITQTAKIADSSISITFFVYLPYDKK